MASEAAKRFYENVADVTRLTEIHNELGGRAPGRRYALEVLNKSAIVMITAFWEAYCEDLAEEALTHLIDEVSDASELPKELKKQVANDVKKDKNELAVWDLAGKGWQRTTKTRFKTLTAERNRSFNTPKSFFVDELFQRALGLKNVSNEWRWKGMSAKKAREKLDKFIELRGSIAHRGKSSSSVKKVHVRQYHSHVVRLVKKTGPQVRRFCKHTTGKKPW